MEIPLENINFIPKITTNSKDAQDWFSRALLQKFDFNHDEAVICCEKAIEYDKNCAMIYFLKSYCYGINYNNCPQILTQERVKQQYNSWQLASKNNYQITEIEKKLIQALGFRVGDGKTQEHKIFDEIFSQKMKNLHEEYPNNELIGFIYCESLMCQNPWTMWYQNNDNQHKEGDPKKDTLEVKQKLEKFLKINPRHVGFRHLYIHLMELSPFPELAGDHNFPEKLRDIVPFLNHLCHMPSHIDIQIGNYEESTKSNKKGTLAGLKYFNYRTNTDQQKICEYLIYLAHNMHFQVYGAMLGGNYKDSIEGSEQLLQLLDSSVFDQQFFNQSLSNLFCSKLYSLIRFGKWNEILNEPFQPFFKIEFFEENKQKYGFILQTYKYSQVLALCVLAGQEKQNYEKYLLQAEKIIQEYDKDFDNLPDTVAFFNNSQKSIHSISREIMMGEYLYRKERFEESFQRLRQANYLYDNLNYEEPWAFMIPTRHISGALILEHGILTKNIQLVEEAEKYYREDLCLLNINRHLQHPNNIWALIGLIQCLEYKNENQEIQKLKQLLSQQKQYSDIDLKASCLCSIKKIKTF